MADNDPVIGAMLFALERLILNLKWTVDPFKDDNGKSTKQDEDLAKFVESCMNDMEDSWDATVASILSFLVYGWSYCEIW